MIEIGSIFGVVVLALAYVGLIDLTSMRKRRARNLARKRKYLDRLREECSELSKGADHDLQLRLDKILFYAKELNIPDDFDPKSRMVFSEYKIDIED